MACAPPYRRPTAPLYPRPTMKKRTGLRPMSLAVYLLLVVLVANLFVPSIAVAAAVEGSTPSNAHGSVSSENPDVERQTAVIGGHTYHIYRYKVPPRVISDPGQPGAPGNPGTVPPPSGGPATPSPNPNPPGTPDPGSLDVSAQEARMLEMINNDRSAAGLGKLRLDPTMARLARLKAEDMANNNYFDHRSQTYGTAFDMMKGAGITYSKAAENLAGNASLEGAYHALSNSPEHRGHMMDPQFTRAGVGIAKGGSYGMMFVQFFADEPPVQQPPVQQPPAQQPPVPVPDEGKFVLGYFTQWWSGDTKSWDSFQGNYDKLSGISPLWYTLQPDGSLDDKGYDQEKIADFAHSKGKKVIAMINNNGKDEFLKDSALRSRAITNIVQMLTSKGYDGVDIDFEPLPGEDRRPLTDFIAALSGQLKARQKTLVVSVGAKWSTDESLNDAAIAYDYQQIGKYSDYVQIMSYDQYHGGAGPVASIKWVQAIIEHAVTLIPAEKILLGIAGYGYDYSDNGNKDTVAGRDAVPLAVRYGAAVIWDDESQTPHFSYVEKGLRHDVWFENGYSVAFKLNLVNNYNLGGATLWSLGQEDDYMWKVISSKLKIR